MQGQNPVQAPIAFEAIAAKMVWQCCLAIDAWQIFYLTINRLQLIDFKAEVVELADTPS